MCVNINWRISEICHKFSVSPAPSFLQPPSLHFLCIPSTTSKLFWVIILWSVLSGMWNEGKRRCDTKKERRCEEIIQLPLLATKWRGRITTERTRRQFYLFSHRVRRRVKWWKALAACFVLCLFTQKQFISHVALPISPVNFHLKMMKKIIAWHTWKFRTMDNLIGASGLLSLHHRKTI